MVADNVRLICARRGVTQVELAAVIGISKMGVSDRFRYVTSWSLEDLDRVAEYLGVPVGVLLGAVDSDETTGAGGPLLRARSGRRRAGPGPIGQPLPELGDVGRTPPGYRLA